MTLEDEFTAALRHTIQAALRLDYTPKRFAKMLNQFGGVATAQRLISTRDSQSGLAELWIRGLQNESMEAVMLRPEFRSLFNAVELAEANHRLKDPAKDNSSIA